MATLEWGDTYDAYTKALGTTFTSTPMATRWSGCWTGGDNGQMAGIDKAYARPGAGAGHGMNVQGTAGRWPYKVLPGGNLATRCVSGWVNFNAQNTTTGVPIFGFVDAATIQCDIRLDSSGHILVTRNATILATSTNVLSPNQWYHIQFKATINNTTGAYEVRVNGTSVGWIPAATGANTRASANNYANWLVVGGNTWYHDDTAVWDDFPGLVSGTLLKPVAAGFYSGWTPNSGNRHGAVADHMTPDDDQSFIASTASADVVTFVMDDVPADGAVSIPGIQIVAYAKQDAGVARTVRPKQRAGGVDYNGVSVGLGPSYAWIVEARSIDPATGLAYTKTSLDGAEFGIENV